MKFSNAITKLLYKVSHLLLCCKYYDVSLFFILHLVMPLILTRKRKAASNVQKILPSCQGSACPRFPSSWPVACEGVLARSTTQCTAYWPAWPTPCSCARGRDTQKFGCKCHPIWVCQSPCWWIVCLLEHGWKKRTESFPWKACFGRCQPEWNVSVWFNHKATNVEACLQGAAVWARGEARRQISNGTFCFCGFGLSGFDAKCQGRTLPTWRWKQFCIFSLPGEMLGWVSRTFEFMANFISSDKILPSSSSRTSSVREHISSFRNCCKGVHTPNWSLLIQDFAGRGLSADTHQHMLSTVDVSQKSCGLVTYPYPPPCKNSVYSRSVSPEIWLRIVLRPLRSSCHKKSCAAQQLANVIDVGVYSRFRCTVKRQTVDSGWFANTFSDTSTVSKLTCICSTKQAFFLWCCPQSSCQLSEALLRTKTTLRTARKYGNLNHAVV